MKNRILHTLLIAFFCLNGFIVSGQYIFNNTTGDGLWSTATNWSTGTVPPNLIPNGTTVTIAANCTYNDIYAFGIHGIFTINPSVTFNLINGNDFVVYADGILNHNGTITAGILANLGTINVGGTVANPGTFTMPTLFDNRSTGIININDYGTVKLPPINPANPGATNINSGVININSGGNLEIRQASFTALPGVVNQNSGSTVTVGAASSYILTSNLTLPLGRKIDILGSMTINSGITLTNDGTIGVHTLTNNGTLINNGEMPNNNNGRITNNSTLSGTGSQDCALTNNGFFYPGGSNTVGCYRFNTPSSASLAAGTTVMDITGTDVCTSQDQVVQVGTAYPGGVLNLRFGSYIPPYGTTFQIFRVTGGTTYFGNFSAVNVSPSTSNILVSYDQYTGLITIVDPCPPPTTVTVDYQTLGANTADILWQQIIGATGYELQYKKSSVATTPLGITPNSATTTNATVSAQPFTAPAGYNAPNVKWTVESAAASPDMNITFTWHYQLNSISYNNSILNGGGVPKIYRLDGATWVEVPSSTVTLSGSANSLQSITASNLTTLGTFAVMTSALPTPSVIQATTNPPYCQGGSVTLTGNVGGVWSTGATTSSITVTTSGNYSVTNTNASGSVTSNILNITFNALPSCTITGNTTFCTGQSTQLCVSLGATNYLWNTGATSNCISANAAGTYSVTVTANGCSSPCSQTVTIDCPITTITSKQTGVWTDASTWQGDVVPTASNNVIIRTQDAVTANVSGGDCRNLTVNGTLSVLGSLNVEDGSSDAANYNKLVLVNGALNLSSGSMVIKGRLQFGTGSSFAMGQDSHLTINSTGTTAANSITTQPLIDASGLTSMNVADGSTLSFGVVHPNLTEPIIKGNFDFRTTACSGSTTIEFADSPNATLRFGTDGTTQRFYDFTSIGTSSKNFVFTNTIIERFATISGGTITGTNCKINGLSLANATLNGSFELFTNCESREPFFEQAGSIVTNASNFNLKINAIGNAYFYLSNIYGNLNLLGTLNVFSGKVFLESGTLNLANATLTGTSGSNYFLTQPSSYVNLAVSNGVAKTFDVGRRDNFAATNAYTPLSIVSNTTTTSAVAVNTQTFTAPTGYLAPNVQWTIQSTEFLSSPNMSITFSWPTSIESGGFTTNRSNAKVYRYNGSTWVELSSSIVTTALGISSITAPNVTTLGLFAVMTPRVAATITSLQNGNWNQTTTWDFGVPTAIDNVIIAHTVRNNNPNSPYSCNNLTINDNATLDQAGRLIIGGNLTINGTFNHNPYTDPSAVSTEIGARRIGGIYGTNATEPAGKHLVTVSGTLALGGSTFDCGMALAGRIVFNGGSTFSMSYASTLTLTGWADPNDATPQYLMDIDRLGTADLYNSQSSIIVTHSNGTQPVISTGKNFIESNCNFYNPTLTNVGFTLLDNTTQYFGGATQRQMNAIVMGSNTTLNLMNTTLRLLSARNGGSVYSSGGQFSSLTAGNGTTLYGDYTLVDHCFTQYPLVYFTNIGNLSFDNSMTLNINVTKEALLYIPNGVTQNLYGTFNFQNGKAVVLGGTLDLRNATAINGFSPTRYFETRRGENLSGINVSYTGLGAVLLPVAVNDVTPVTFSLGVTIPNGGSPRSVYAPVSILAPSSTNSSPSNVSVSLEPLTVPSGFVAPTVKWEITPSGSPTLSITFRWTAASESYSFSVNRSRARVYHYNTGTSVWAQLNSGAVTGPDADGLYSLTVTGVTNFSPFAVMIPTSALSAELVNFTAKNEGQKAQLTWQTASEINVKNFDVEKSLDGKTFDKISETKANNTPSVYSAFDNDFTASAYYRLKINDLDGTTRFSKIVYLDKNNDKGIKISRNTEGSILIETDDKIELITVSNTVGQVVKTTKDKQLLINDLTAGIYIISVKTDKGFLSQKVFKER